MTGPHVFDRLTDYLLDEVAGEERASITRHLEACAACRVEAERSRQTILLLKQHGPTLPTALTPARREQVVEQAGRPQRGWRLPASMAAALVLIASASLIWLRENEEREAPAPTTVASSTAVPTSSTPEPAAPTMPPPPPTAAGTSVPASPRKETPGAGLALPEGPGMAPGGVEGGVVGGVLGGAVGTDEALDPSTYRVTPSYDDDYTRLKTVSVEEIERDARRDKNPPTRRSLRPPNGAPAPDMFFEHQGTNPFLQTEEDRLSTFGLDVDTASYAITRSYLLRGALPPPAAVRVEEFVNAFPTDYASDPKKTFTIHVDGAPNPFHSGYHVLRVGIKAREIAARDRRRANLVFVIDVSGSMAQENRLDLVKTSLHLLTRRLHRDDRVGIVAYGSNARVVLEPTAIGEAPRIHDAIQRLRPEGSTNLEDGLRLGYEMAERAFTKKASNRVVLCTDGVANTGETNAERLLEQIEGKARRGIDLMALGFGMGNYNDVLLQQLADRGNGQYAYIDDGGEARAFFLRDLAAVLEVVARDAKAQVELDPERVERYRLLGYEKRDVADPDFRNDAVDGGEVNSGHTVTVLYEVKLRSGGGGGDLGTVRVRYADPETRRVTEDARRIRSGDLAASFEAAGPRFRLSVVMARFAEHLRGSYWAKGEPLSLVLSEARKLPADLRRSEAAELIELIGVATSLHPERDEPEGRDDR